ncbi:hypothetical protein K438DRAFT_240345 [Mycena galopus ATCC 62051]|nr:hypothetical protein K438DRAFT_240345 [Mycena galopus ATCC 62051]
MSALPPELERKIFEIAALSDSGTIPPLLRVARRVLEWIEPLLYRVLVIDGSPRAKPFHRAFQLKPNVVAGGVRHVSFIGSGLWLAKDMQGLLRLCGPRLLSLAGSRSTDIRPILPHLSQLRRWGGNLALLFGGYSVIDLSISAFRTLTHMDIWGGIEADDTVICPGLAALPCLTHLCLSDRGHWQAVLPRISAQCLQLQVLVSMPGVAATAQLLATDPPTRDVRFVVCIMPDDYWNDWEVGARGGTDFWAAADDFVTRKRRGEIEASCFLLDHW